MGDDAKPSAPAKDPKKMTPAERMDEILGTQAVTSAVAGAGTGEQFKAWAATYFKGREALLVNYVDATQKLMEARISNGLPPEAAEGEKLTDEQSKALKDAQAKADAAYKAAAARIGSTGTPDALQTDKDTLKKVAAAYAAPKAKEAHGAMLKEVQEKVAKRWSVGWFGSTVTRRIKQLKEAGSDEEKKAAKAALAEAIANDRLTGDLTKADQAALVETLSGNVSTVVAENEKANATLNKVENMAEDVKKQALAQVNPKNMIQDAMGASGLNPIMNVAKKILPGAKSP